MTKISHSKSSSHPSSGDSGAPPPQRGDSNQPSSQHRGHNYSQMPLENPIRSSHLKTIHSLLPTAAAASSKRPLKVKASSDSGSSWDIKSPPQLSSFREKWPDFVDFIKKSGLEDLLKGSGHSIKQTSEGEPMLPLEGEMQPWSEIKRRFAQDTSWSGSQIPLSWRYDSLGLHHVSMSQWDKLLPTSQEAPHPGCWYIDIMSTTVGMKHAWVRLVDEKGQVHSVGMAGEIHKFAMFRGQVAKINSPDHREFTSEPHNQTRVAINQEQYEKAMAKVIADQQDHNLYFNLLSRNCSVYASEVALEAGLYLNNLEFASQILSRSLLGRIHLHIPKILLKVAYAVSYLARAIVGTLFNTALGAWYQDRRVVQLEQQHGHKWKRRLNKPFRSWKSFIDGTNYQLRSTFKLAEWQKFAQRYRQERLAAFDALKSASQLKLSFLSTARFNELWSDLRLNIEYEKPPKLDQKALFLGSKLSVDTKDLPLLVARWEQSVSSPSSKKSLPIPQKRLE